MSLHEPNTFHVNNDESSARTCLRLVERIVERYGRNRIWQSVALTPTERRRLIESGAMKLGPGIRTTVSHHKKRYSLFSGSPRALPRLTAAATEAMALGDNPPRGAILRIANKCGVQYTSLRDRLARMRRATVAHGENGRAA